MAADASEIVAKVKQFIELVDKYLEKSRTVSYWTGFVDQQLKQGLKPSLIADGNKNRYRRSARMRPPTCSPPARNWRAC